MERGGGRSKSIYNDSLVNDREVREKEKLREEYFDMFSRFS
jgi:uncharacterized protein YnzC (UPF0291/DUF896 family)